jgi:hypothetical protein
MNIEVNGNHLGLVVQNNDPEKRGRVKVWVPHVSVTVYNNWNQTFSDLLDKHIVFPDEKTNPDLDKILPYLKECLPWAETAMPLFGGSASGRYNAYTKKGTTSDSNFWEKDLTTQKAQVIEGFRPLHLYTGENRLVDAFTETGNVGNKFANPHAYDFEPSDYSNLARGAFTIPNVGAHVWIFFAGGDPNYPVVFASSYGQEDWSRIYSLNKDEKDVKKFISMDYPASYENVAANENPTLDHNMQTFRSKTVLNSNKHSIELVDTDQREILKFTSYSGSFLEFNNFTTSQFSANNYQQLVQGDFFSTIKKNKSQFIGGHFEDIIHGDKYVKIGDYKSKEVIAKDIYDIIKGLHEYKRLFEIDRAFPDPLHTSLYQLRAGAPSPCPCCLGTGIMFLDPCKTCNGTGLSPSTQDGLWLMNKIKWEPVGRDWLWYEHISKLWVAVPPPKEPALMWDAINKTWINTIIPQPIDPEHPIIDSATWIPHHPIPEATMYPDLVNKIRDAQRLLLPLEAAFGDGGDKIESVTGSTDITIGTIFNELASYRMDPVGKLKPSNAVIAPLGTYVSYKAVPLLEYVDVDDVPGGDYNLTVCNKYTLTVGNKGIRIKTGGPLDIYGAMVNVTGESVNISSANEVLIDGGERVDISGSVISLSPHDRTIPAVGANDVPRSHEKTVIVNGNLDVAENMKVVGGVHVEGELSMLHMTAPDFRYQTEIALGPLPHVHVFHAPPWVLMSPYLPDKVLSAMETRVASKGKNETLPHPNLHLVGFRVPA